MAELQKIVPSIWCDHNAQEMVDFYVSVFPGSKILSTARYPETSADGLADFQQDLAGQVLTIEFEIAGHQYTAINAGPEFKPNPSVSFMVNFDPAHDDQAREHLDEVWAQLIEGGEALMPLDEYPHSKHYGWAKDKYGYSWQLILTNPEGEDRPCIIPTLMFTKSNTNKAEEAITYYTSVFENSKIGTIARYGAAATSNLTAESLTFADFQLAGQWFAAMDAGSEHDFVFNEAVSFVVTCETQEEIDRYWEKLSSVPESEQCGWCKDKYGVSWQIVPANMGELMSRPDAFAHMMQMKKIVIADF